MYTLAMVVFITSILVFFSQEFIRTFKKIMEIKGVGLFLPLFVFSWLIYDFHEWTIVMLYYYREFLTGLLRFLTHILPYKPLAIPLGQIIILTTMTVGPVYALDRYLERQTFYGYQYIFITCAIIWVITAAVLVIAPPVL